MNHGSTQLISRDREQEVDDGDSVMGRINRINRINRITQGVCAVNAVNTLGGVFVSHRWLIDK